MMMALWALCLGLMLPSTMATLNSSLKCNTTVHNNVTFVDCRHRQLKRIPSGLSPLAAVIDLSYNSIQEVGFGELFVHLTTLSLSYNNVSCLSATSFKHMPFLKTLRLDYNRISLTPEAYPNNVFLPLKTLRVLHIQGNDDRTEGSYPDAAFSFLTRLEELRVDTFLKTEFGYGFGKMKRLKRLLLNGSNMCALNYLGNETLRIFENSSIEILNLDSCPMFDIEPDAFWWLKNLQELHVSDTMQLSPQSAIASMWGLRGRNMTAITFDRVLPLFILRENNLEEFILSTESINNGKDVCVKRFSMRQNQLLWVEYDSWHDSRFARCIEHLDLSGNDFYGQASIIFKLSSMPRLKYFDISRRIPSNNPRQLNGHTDPQVRQLNGQSQLQVRQLNGQYELQVRQLNGHPDYQVKKMRLIITLPGHLEYGDLTGFTMNGIQHFPEVEYVNASYFREARFAYNGVERFENRVIGLETLSTFDISGNACGNMILNYFDDFPGLKKLNMSDCDLSYPDGYFLNGGPRLFANLTNLETVILSRNELTLINPIMFLTNPVRVLDFSYNRFEDIPIDLDTTGKLEYLDLGYNSLTHVEASKRNLLGDLAVKNGLVLNLRGNLMSCSCRNIGTLLWFQETAVQIDNFNTYTCLYSNGSSTRIPQSQRELLVFWRRCYGQFWLFTGSVIGLALILIITLCYIISIKTTMLVNALLRVFFGFNTVMEKPSRDDYIYDVFLGYSEEDREYVIDAVTPIETRHMIRAYITDRDMLGGSSIPQEIIRGVDSSWRIVLVITQAFLEDNWCRFVSDYVVYVSTLRTSGSVLMIVSDDVRLAEIPPSLLNVLEEKHIFKVGDYHGDECSMWNDVIRSIQSQ